MFYLWLPELITDLLVVTLKKLNSFFCLWQFGLSEAKCIYVILKVVWFSKEKPRRFQRTTYHNKSYIYIYIYAYLPGECKHTHHTSSLTALPERVGLSCQRLSGCPRYNHSRYLYRCICWKIYLIIIKPTYTPLNFYHCLYIRMIKTMYLLLYFDFPFWRGPIYKTNVNWVLRYSNHRSQVA